MSFLIVTGPTNAGKTTYANALAEKGVKVFNFDSYYRQSKGEKSLVSRYRKTCLTLLTNALNEYKGGFAVVCEGPQFLVPSILAQTLETISMTSVVPRFIFLAPTAQQTIQNLIARNRGKNRKNRIYLEQAAFSLTSYLYFHLSKKVLFDILKDSRAQVTILDNREMANLWKSDTAYG